MPASEITFAELMRDAGFQTACIGKWDVSNRRAIRDRMPNAQGFEYYFGTLGANDDGKVVFHENNEQVGATREMGSLTKLYTDKAIEFLREKRDAQKPFVLYVAHTMMHTIIDASDAFRGRSAGGLYGDVVEEFDHEFGRLLDALDELGLSQDTLVIYTSDNGPWNQPKYTRNKKGHPDGAIFWAMRARCGMERDRVTKLDIEYPASSAGPGECLPGALLMRFSRPSISCRPSPNCVDSRCPEIDVSTASTSPHFCWASRSLDGVTSTSMTRAFEKESGSSSSQMRSFTDMPSKTSVRRLSSYSILVLTLASGRIGRMTIQTS